MPELSLIHPEKTNKVDTDIHATMVKSTTLPPRSPRPTGGQPKQKGRMNALKIVGGKVRSASPFRKKYISTPEKAEVPQAQAAEDDARVERSQNRGRDEFEEGRDMYDPGATLNSLTRSLSLESDTETEDEESILSGKEDEASLNSHEVPPQEAMPQPEGKVFTKSVVLSTLNTGDGAGDSLVLRAQHRFIKPEKESHAFINVRVSGVKRCRICLQCLHRTYKMHSLKHFIGIKRFSI